MLGNGRKVCYTTLMAKKINPGQKFGNLTVISDTGERKRRRSIWNCRCICGTDIERDSADLLNPHKQSCGKKSCAVPIPTVEPGAVFGKLTVIEYDHTNEHRAIFWKCRCECGREVLVRGQCLRNGMTVSCGNKGCRQTGDLSGQTFGLWTVLRKDDERSVNDGGQQYYICRCACGRESSVEASRLKRGKSLSCGQCVEMDRKRAQSEVGRTRTQIEHTNLSLVRRDKANENSKTGVRGVSFESRTGKYVAQISFRSKHYYLGQYSTVEAAKKARKEAEERIFRPFLEHYEQDLKEDHEAEIKAAIAEYREKVKELRGDS